MTSAQLLRIQNRPGYWLWMGVFRGHGCSTGMPMRSSALITYIFILRTLPDQALFFPLPAWAGGIRYMRIGNSLPPLYVKNPAPARPSAYAQPVHNKSGSGITVDISPEALAAAARKKSGSAPRTDYNATECKTCSGRKYQDVSSDPSVSFQTPAHISPSQSASGVAAHESEHVSHEQAKAQQDGREIVSQTVRLSTSICPECKRVYVSGGVTQTISVKVDTFA